MNSLKSKKALRVWVSEARNDDNYNLLQKMLRRFPSIVVARSLAVTMACCGHGPKVPSQYAPVALPGT